MRNPHQVVTRPCLLVFPDGAGCGRGGPHGLLGGPVSGHRVLEAAAETAAGLPHPADAAAQQSGHAPRQGALAAGRAAPPALGQEAPGRRER